MNDLSANFSTAANLTTFGVCTVIAAALGLLVFKRRDFRFRLVMAWAAAFFFCCGLGHLAEAAPGVLEGWRGPIELATAVAACGALVALLRMLPRAFTMPGLERLNEQLAAEVEERKRAEEEVRRLHTDLQERLEELEALLEVLPVGIGIASDPRCEHIRSNRAFAEILRLAPEANASLSGAEAPRHFKVTIGGREIAPDELPIQRAAREGVIVRDLEEEIVFDDGRRAFLLAYAAPLHDGSETVRGAVGAFIDITARKTAEAERQQVERKLQETQKLESLGVLAGGIAHDFNNLLTGVVGHASLARMDLPGTSPVMPYLAEIEEAAQRAADLCKQMLAYAGRGRFVIQSLDVSAVLRETTFLLESSAGHNAQLHFHLAPNLPPVRADATQLRQVVMNLVTNAAEAIGANQGAIQISTGTQEVNRAWLSAAVTAPELPEGRYVFLEVSDTGAGMTPETIARIFDPFFSTRFTGRGLGLAAVLGIVRGHRGAMNVTSTPGRGSTFRIVLPCAEGAPVAAPAEPGKSAPWRGHGSVLLVDDEATVRATAARMLQTFGFTTHVAAGGIEGLELFRSQRESIIAVVLDLTMPEMNGEAVFRELRSLRADLPVLLMSGYDEQEAMTPFAGQGRSGFLQKPFTLTSLKARLRELLERP